MDILKLQQIFKKFDLLDDSPSVTILEQETLDHFNNTLKFLKNFAKFLNLYKGNNQEFIMAMELAELSSDPEKNKDSNLCIIFDFKKVFENFRSASSLPENVDINYCVLELFSGCLWYIINLIHEEPENITDIYEHFEQLGLCFNVFSETSVILNTKSFQNTISFFIADLMKLLTRSEFSINKPNLLSGCNLIRKMLTELAKILPYRDIILRQILKRIKCALSYYKANQNFDGYIADQIYVFEYFFWIIKTILNDCCDVGSNLDDKFVFEMKEVLEEAKKCLENKIPSIVMNLLIKILVVL